MSYKSAAVELIAVADEFCLMGTCKSPAYVHCTINIELEVTTLEDRTPLQKCSQCTHQTGSTRKIFQHIYG